jgi:hypothetical protein
MGMLAIANMLLLVVGFLMRLRKQKRDRINKPPVSVAIEQLTQTKG